MSLLSGPHTLPIRNETSLSVDDISLPIDRLHYLLFSVEFF